MTVCILKLLCIKTAKRGKLLNDIVLEAISAGFYSSRKKVSCAFSQTWLKWNVDRKISQVFQVSKLKYLKSKATNFHQYFWAFSKS